MRDLPPRWHSVGVCTIIVPDIDVINLQRRKEKRIGDFERCAISTPCGTIFVRAHDRNFWDIP